MVIDSELDEYLLKLKTGFEYNEVVFLTFIILKSISVVLVILTLSIWLYLVFNRSIREQVYINKNIINLIKDEII